MSSSSTLPNKYFNRLQVNRLQAINSTINDLIANLDTILQKLINEFNNSGVLNSTQILHLDTLTNELDVSKNIKIGNKILPAINTISCFVKLTINKINKIDDDTFLILLKDNYDVTMYTTYTKQNRIFNNNFFKVEEIKECSEYMIKDGTNCVASFNNDEFIYLINIVDGHFQNNGVGLVGYIIKPLKNLKTGEIFNKGYFPIDLKNVNCNININKSIFNCIKFKKQKNNYYAVRGPDNGAPFA